MIVTKEPNMKMLPKRLPPTKTLSLLVFVSMISCSKPNAASQNNTDANLSSINLKIPSGLDSVKDKSDSGNLLLTAYKISIQAKEETGCKFSAINEIKTLTDKLDFRLPKNCEYSILLSLGKIDSNELKPVYFAMDKALVVTKDTVNKNKATLQVSLSLPASAEFFADASEDSVQQIMGAGNSGNNNNNNNNNNKPTPDQKPGPEIKSSNLDPKYDIGLTNDKGSVMLSALVGNSPYFFIDFSAPWCGPCLQLAQQLENDAAFKSIFKADGKCKMITVAMDSHSGNEKSLTEWLQRMTSFGINASDHSYNAADANDVKTRFAVHSYPTALLFTTSGSTMTPLQDSGSIPAAVKAACQ